MLMEARLTGPAQHSPRHLATAIRNGQGGGKEREGKDSGGEGIKGNLFLPKRGINGPGYQLPGT